MKEILAGNLQSLFENTSLTGVCTYKGKMYEVWEVSDETFKNMCGITDEEFVDIAGEDAWWRHSLGSNLGYPDTKVHIKGKEMLGWGGEPWEDEEEDDEFEVYASSLTDYLCDVVGASLPKNVCACAMDLAKYNNMTMGELFKMYEK